jgi:hypothetical protein
MTAVQGAFQGDRELGPGHCIIWTETVITAASRYSSIRQVLYEMVGRVGRGNISEVPDRVVITIVPDTILVGVLPLSRVIGKNIGVITGPVIVPVGAFGGIIWKGIELVGDAIPITIEATLFCIQECTVDADHYLLV